MQGTRAFVTDLPDGRKNYVWHQSALNTADQCLERLRLGLSGDMPEVENDAACTGTALHAGIDWYVHTLLECSEPINAGEMLDYAEYQFAEMASQDNFQWIKRATFDSVNKYLAQCVDGFYREVAPKLRPIGHEVPFGPYTIYEDDERVIQIGGTIDYVDETGIWDWKTGTAHSWAGKDWERHRWAIQPTVYTLGYEMYNGYTWESIALKEQHAQDASVPFTFCVFRDDGYVQWVQTQRTAGDWRWLVQKCLNLSRLVESGVAPWPLNDQHALCSPKWCPAWDQCKGRYVDAGWPYHRDV